MYFPAWYLGTFPDRRVILASYNADFAAEWGMKVRDLLEEVGEEFFGIRVRADRRAIDSTGGSSATTAGCRPAASAARSPAAAPTCS
jgi:hypothetical protein